MLLGPVFVVLGLTGSIIAFRPELDEWLNASEMRVEAPFEPSAYASLDRLAAAAREAIPPDATPYAFVFPRTPGSAFWVTYSLPAPTPLNPKQVEWHQVFLHPATAAVLGQRLMLDLGRPWRGPVVNVAQSIHRTLALGPYSPLVLGVLAILLMLSLVTGLVLWWPRPGRWRSAVTRLESGRGQLALNLHNLVGAWSSVVLLVVLFAGIHLVQPRWIRSLIHVGFTTTSPPAGAASTPGGVPLGFDQAAAMAQAHYPDGRMWMIRYPQGPTGIYRVFRPSPHELTRILPSRQVWLDQYTGAVLYEFGPHTYTWGDRIEQTLYPLHSGEALGLPGRLVVSLSGVVPLLLLVTGCMRWWQKRRARVRP